MSQITVKQKIFMALDANENGFMSVEDIAKVAYGDAYMKETKKHLKGLIQRNISHGIALLSEYGKLVVTLKEPTAPGSKMTFKNIVGYKIADKSDSSLILDNLQSKEERLESSKQLALSFQELAVEAKVIEPTDLKRLN